MIVSELEARALGKTWFYPYVLPSGRRVLTYLNGELDGIHETRVRMMMPVIESKFGASLSGKSVLDIACHQGYFSWQLARRGAAVTACDVRTDHVEDATLVRDLYGLDNLKVLQSDVFKLDERKLGRFDLVVMFGLIYHLENPVGALRVAHRHCKGLCLVETQVVPNLSGVVDWGNWRYNRMLQGCFGIADETDVTTDPESSVTGICLAPSTEGLLWIMRAIGFKRVELVAVPDPESAYEQLRFGKRVMVAGYVD